MMALFACVAITLTIPKPSVDFERLALAVEAKEAGAERHPWSKPGGAANWKRQTWAQYSTLDYSRAQQPKDSRETMVHMFADYARRYLALGRTPSAWLLATAYLKGFDGALRERRTRGDYGECCENLASEARL